MGILFGSLLILGGLGLFFGLLLSFAGTKLKTNLDPKLAELIDSLPGVNCGGCGRPGCGAFAEDLFAEKVETSGCPVGGEELNQKLAGIMGVEASAMVRKVAYVKCIGGESRSTFLYNYEGVINCRALVRLAAEGNKECTNGCLGGESCVQSCMFDAIKMLDGIAVIIEDKCTGCNVCVSACPKRLIEMVPYDKKIRVGCFAHEGAKAVRATCSIGCIGCKLCQKNCPETAIEMEGSLAKIVYDRCSSCGVCVQKCPRKCIL